MQLLTDPVHLIQYGGVILLLAIIFLETGTILGLVLPGGDYLLFTAGILSGTHYLDLSLGLLLGLMMLAAILGDFTGYVKGRWLGSRLFNREDARIFKKSHLEKTRSFYEKYGMLAFITGRFLPVIRTLIPMLAGATRLPVRKFSILNIVGAFLWIGTLTPLGYFLGNRYPDIMDYSLYFLLGFILIASMPMLKVLNPFGKK